MKKLLNWSLLLLALVAMNACEGPQGPIGPAGSDGGQGPQGTPGQQGIPGSANVVYSSWARAGTWSTVDVFGVVRSFVDITAPRLTQEIVDRGVVLVYTKLTADNNQARQLPVTVFAQFTEELIDFSIIVSRIRIWSTPINGPAFPSPNYEFRYVIIPGAQAARMNYEKLSYDDAKVMFNLPD